MSGEVCNLLLINDRADDRAEVRRLLLDRSHRRYQFTETATELSGVRAALDAGGSPDCIVLGYDRPDTQVEDVLAALAGPDGLAACPVVVLTGHTSPDHGRRVLRAGAQDVLGKSWMTAESLTLAVESAVERWCITRDLRTRTAALQASEQRLQLAVDVAKLGVIRIDYATNTAVLDDVAAALYGLAAGVPLPRTTVHATFHPDDRAEIDRRMHQSLDPTGTGAFSTEHRVIHPDGSVHWLSVKKQIVFAGRAGARTPVTALLAAMDITERKAFEEQLRASETFNRGLMEGSSDCIKVLDLDGRLLHMNGPGLCALEIDDFGPFCGQPWPALWPADQGPEIQRAVASARDGRAYSFQACCPTAKGTPRWWDVAVTAVRSPATGHVVQLLAVSRDITSQKQAEALLIARERGLRAIADNSPDILTRFDRDLRHVFVNAAVERATGRPATDFLGKTNRDLNMPDALCAKWENAIRYVFDAGQHKSLEFAFDSPTGPRRYSTRLVPERDASGRVEFVLGVTTDVTDRRRAETAEREAGERLEMALAAARAGVWGWDVTTGALAWSPENYALYGRDPAAGPLTYADWEERVHPDDRGRATAAVRDALEGRSPEFRSEFRVDHPADGVRWLLGLGRVEFGPDGTPARLAGINLDITERKRFEQTLADQDRRKDEFLATLAHELRNPLAPLRNGLAILRMTRDPAQVESALGVMGRQVGQMVHLVDDLLDVARVSSGKVVLRADRLSVQEVVAAAVEACRPTFDDKGHTLTVDLPAEPLAVTGDRTRLIQVVANLLTNAAKYSERGASARVSARPAGGAAVLEVADTGMGIPAELLPTLWDMFTQVRDTLDKAQGGLGIGLSLVKKLVELHGGTVAAASPGVGRGSTFTVRLPLAAAADGPAASGRQGDAAPAPPPAGRRVLVVDDNRDGVQTLSLILKLSGHQVVTAESGPAALEVAATFQPEVVLLDIGLPGMDGYEVARRLRADPATAGAVLVALTGWGTDEDKRKSRDAGFDHHLTKPVEADAVAELLTRKDR